MGFTAKFTEEQKREKLVPLVEKLSEEVKGIQGGGVADAVILGDDTIYQTAAVEARLYRNDEASAATERIRTRTWTRVKTAK